VLRVFAAEAGEASGHLSLLALQNLVVFQIAPFHRDMDRSVQLAE